MLRRLDLGGGVEGLTERCGGVIATASRDDDLRSGDMIVQAALLDAEEDHHGVNQMHEPPEVGNSAHPG